MLSYSHQFAKKLKSTSMSQENTILDACLFRVGKLVRFQSQMHLSKICQVQAPVVQKVDIFVPQRRPAPIVLLSRSSYTKEFTCKLDCSSYLSGYCTRDHESSDRCWPPLGIKIYFIPKHWNESWNRVVKSGIPGAPSTVLENFRRRISRPDRPPLGLRVCILTL